MSSFLNAPVSVAHFQSLHCCSVLLILNLSTRPSMAAAAAAGPRPPPAHPGPNGGNQFSGPNCGVTNTGQQEPGLQGTSQDQGPSYQGPSYQGPTYQGPSSHPQHYVPPRPIFCIPAPPPPFLQYQWPMPLPYNPFAGFQGMGYGMVMPPFPLPPYMEAPAYIVPTPHIQPVDYRRLLHPQMHASSAPYQNPNHNRRVRLPLPFKESVNSAVQTETPQRGGRGSADGSPPGKPDSGHGSVSNSPSSTSSSTQKQSSAEDENVTSTGRNDKVNHGFNVPYQTVPKTVHSRIRASGESVGQENVHPYRNGHCNVWSVSSPDSMVPVCSSSQQDDEVVKERRVSFPDILMSWGGGSPQATMLEMTDGVPRPNEGQLPPSDTEIEQEKNSGHQSGTGNKNDPVVLGRADAIDGENILTSKDDKILFKILRLPFALELLSKSRGKDECVGLVGSGRRSLPHGDELLYDEQENVETNPHEDTADIIPYQMSRMNRQMNESVWSVESLVPFIPFKEGLHLKTSASGRRSLPHGEELLHDEQENVETNPHEDTADIVPYPMSRMNRQINESVWSVESLVPFIPFKEGLRLKGLSEPETTTEDSENERDLSQNDNLTVRCDKERRRCRRFSSSDLELSCPFFSTPAEKLSVSKRPGKENETNASDPKQGHRVAPVEKCSGPPCKVLSTATEEDMDENRSSEPEASRGPNQQCVTAAEQQEKRPTSRQTEEALLLCSAAMEKPLATPQPILQNEVDKEADDGSTWSEDASQLRNTQPCVQVSDQHTEKGCSLDSFTGCNEMCSQCGQEILKRKTERSRGLPGRCSERRSNQQEAFNGNVKPEKSKGGNGRKPRH